MSIRIDPTLYRGRPADCTGRLPQEVATYDLLDRLGIRYCRLDHEPTATIESCEEVVALLGTQMCKNLFLCNRQKTQFYLLMMDGHKSFHTKDLSAQLGVSRLSFADAEHMQAFLHISPGAVSVMGLMNDHDQRVQLLIDRPLLAQPQLGCHPCVNTVSLRLATRDLLEVFLPAVGHEAIVVELPED